MGVEDVLCGADLSTRWSIEADWEDVSAVEWDTVRERRWLEPHLFGLIMTLVFLEDSSVHRCEVLLVDVTRQEILQISGWVARPGLVQRIVPDDVWITRKALGHMVPKAHKFVLKSIFVSEKRIERHKGLLGLVVEGKVPRLTIFDQRVIILILPVAKRLDIRADASLLVER